MRRGASDLTCDKAGDDPTLGHDLGSEKYTHPQHQRYQGWDEKKNVMCELPEK